MSGAMKIDSLIVWFWSHGRTVLLWSVWGLVTLGLLGFGAYRLLSEDKRFYVPGATTNGHYQIEVACTVCHSPFRDEMQENCLNCHGAELKAVEDSHPAKVFRDPRNADHLSKINALECVTCHVEHHTEATREMGVTVAVDFCFHCHKDIAEERPSHTDMGFESCIECHNYHDNQALYEDFLLKHLEEPDLRASAVVASRDYAQIYRKEQGDALVPLNSAEMDAPQAAGQPNIVRDWNETAHANAGINCRKCHQARFTDTTASDPDAWVDKPNGSACAECHAAEYEGFVKGRHGMRLDQGLSPMQVEWARQPMRKEGKGKRLGCTTCHEAHRFDTQRAAVDGCLGCHDDEHSRAYRLSPHYRLWEAEREGNGPPGSGVSCATCHLPRLRSDQVDGVRILVDHNQNANLRPNQKMIRTVCLDCHGLGFSLDALADSEMLQSNFQERPSWHLESLEMVAKRQRGDDTDPGGDIGTPEEIQVGGIRFSCRRAAAQHFGIDFSIFNLRLSRLGWTPEQAAEIEPREEIQVGGIRFPSRSAAAQHFGIDPSVFNLRLSRLGWTPEQAAEIEPRRKFARRKVTVDGTYFPSLKAAAEH